MYKYFTIYWKLLGNQFKLNGPDNQGIGGRGDDDVARVGRPVLNWTLLCEMYIVHTMSCSNY